MERWCGCSLQEAVCQPGREVFQGVQDAYQAVYLDENFFRMSAEIRERRLQQYEQAVQAYYGHLGEVG